MNFSRKGRLLAAVASLVFVGCSVVILPAHAVQADQQAENGRMIAEMVLEQIDQGSLSEADRDAALLATIDGYNSDSVFGIGAAEPVFRTALVTRLREETSWYKESTEEQRQQAEAVMRDIETFLNGAIDNIDDDEIADELMNALGQNSASYDVNILALRMYRTGKNAAWTNRVLDESISNLPETQPDSATAGGASIDIPEEELTEEEETKTEQLRAVIAQMVGNMPDATPEQIAENLDNLLGFVSRMGFSDKVRRQALRDYAETATDPRVQDGLKQTARLLPPAPGTQADTPEQPQQEQTEPVIPVSDTDDTSDGRQTDQTTGRQGAPGGGDGDGGDAGTGSGGTPPSPRGDEGRQGEAPSQGEATDQPAQTSSDTASDEAGPAEIPEEELSRGEANMVRAQLGVFERAIARLGPDATQEEITETLVNIVRNSNLPAKVKRQALRQYAEKTGDERILNAIGRAATVLADLESGASEDGAGTSPPPPPPPGATSGGATGGGAGGGGGGSDY